MKLQPGGASEDRAGDFESQVQSRMAEILRFLLGAVLILLVLTVAINTAVEGLRWGMLTNLAIAAGGVALLLLFARNGRPEIAAIGLLVIFSIVAIGSVYLRGTTRIAATSIIIPAAALAGLFLERRALIVSLAGSVALLGALMYAESAGLLPPAMPGSLVSFFSGLVAISIATGAVLFSARRIAIQALRDSQVELRRRRVTELALRKSERRFRGLTELSSDGFWETGTDHRITEFVPGTGYEPLVPSSNFLGKARWDIGNLHPGNPRGWAPLREAMARHETFRNFELSIGPVNGEVRWYSISGEPLYGSGGDFLGYQGVTRQITERKRVEQAMQLANERLEAALADGHVSIWHVDLRSGEAWLSDGWAQLLGGPPGETRTTVADLMALTHPEDRARGLALSTEAIEGVREVYHYEHRVRTLAGEWRWILSRGRVVERDASGRALRMTGTNIDITERRRAEEELRGSRRLLETVIDALPMSVFAKDLDSNYIMLNKRMAEFFGLPKEELLRRHTSRLPYSGATLNKSLSDDAWVFTHQRTLDQPDIVLGGPDGRQVPYHSTKIPLFDEFGKLSGLLGINRDISAEKRAQEALRESEQRFRAVFERSKAGIAIWGLDGRFLEVNHAFCEFVGYAADQLVGRMSEADLDVPGDEVARDRIGRMARGEIGHAMRDRSFRRRDGSVVWGRATLSVVAGLEGRPQYFVAVVIDITEARAAAQRIERINAELEERVAERTIALRSAVERLEEGNRDLDSFNFSIAHDLRQPLNAIGGFADLLSGSLEDPTPGDLREFAREIESNAVRMEQMIEALLRFSNVGRGALSMVNIDMRCLVESVLRELAPDLSRRVEVAVGELPAATGDEALLRHVWTNLIGNAVKYSGKAAAPRVEISGARYDDALVYTVRDNGVGFDMRDAGHIFGVFERLPSAAGFEGAGVGLAIVQRIVRRHGGQLSAESAPGQGATFRFTLPA
jgi:PAS domain S-box-containing protein